MSINQGSLDIQQPAASNSAGIAAADNGTSLNADGDTVQLGNDEGLTTAQLTNNREIPLNGNSVKFTGDGDVRTGSTISSGARLQNEGTLSTKRRVLLHEGNQGINDNVAVDPVNDNFTIFTSDDIIR